MLALISTLFLSGIVTSLAIPPIISIGLQNNLVDQPDIRKQHVKPIVRLGGLAIFIGCFLGFISYWLMEGNYLFNIIEIDMLKTFVISSTCFFLIGLVDDLFSISPVTRLFFQIAVACFTCSKGIGIISADLSLASQEPLIFYLLNLINLIGTIVWIVGITNAINWMDGLDCLAGGIVFLISSSLFTVSILSEQTLYCAITASLCGACIGFIKHNFKPLNILMGDGGSYFLGSSLAILSLIIISGNQYSFGSINFHISLIAFSLPILDMFFVIIRRIYRGKSPFLPDRTHLHHIFLDIGLSERQTVGLILTICFWTLTIMLTIIYPKIFKILFILTSIFLTYKFLNIRSFKRNK